MILLSCCIGFSSYITAIFAMNLDNATKFEPINGFFISILIITFIFLIASFICGMYYFTTTGIFPTKVHKIIKSKNYKKANRLSMTY